MDDVKLEKRGKPRLPTGIARTQVVHVRLRESEKLRMELAARAAGSRSVSEWMRDRILADLTNDQIEQKTVGAGGLAPSIPVSAETIGAPRS